MAKQTKKKQNFSSLPSPMRTHFPSPIKESLIKSDKEKIDLIADHFHQIMEILGLDLSDDSLAKTPERVAKMYVQEVFSGLSEDNFPSMSFFKENRHHEHKPSIVFVKVGFTSFCEHHFVPMTGFAYVAYLPGDKLIGISKIPRIVRYFAARPQLQERLTAQIGDCLALLLETDDVAVSVHARHFCVLARGIQDENSHMVTNILRGRFNHEEHLRREFFEGISRQDLR